MQGRTPSNTCPHCGSREFWPSRKRVAESLFGPLLPYRPFRCRACLKRYLVAKTWFLPVAGVFLLAVGLAVAAYFLGFRPVSLFSASDAPGRPAVETAANSQAGQQAAQSAPPAPPAPASAAATGNVPPSAQDQAGPHSVFFRLHLNIPPRAGKG
ncbi:hypothetical protein dsx2_1315 [Desulfovibrio sp. X2]|uniref:hypothetical protein n=1 Tax=Desulfovibrio sp. X2 TaxID=941449 RepID=UPI000358E14C|nr:hypothetical protein [Desulfovibrio sp. X2]EPR44687.1 hypothetical protein dsx2_1315 [Desulfovibrio sp. X2]